MDGKHRSGIDSGSFLSGGRPDYGWGTRQEEEGGGSVDGPLYGGSPQTVGGLRTAFAEAKRRDWTDYAIIFGAGLLAIMVVVTMVIALAINARANRIIEDAARRERQGITFIGTLQAQLDRIEKAVTPTTTTTTTTIHRHTPLRTTTTVRSPTPTTTTTRPPAPPTTPPRTTLVHPTPPTTKPCTLAIFDLCLLR